MKLLMIFWVSFLMSCGVQSVRLPVEIHLAEGVPGEFHNTILEAFDIWNNALGREIFVLGQIHVEAEWDASDNYNVIFWDFDMPINQGAYAEWDFEIPGSVSCDIAFNGLIFGQSYVEEFTDGSTRIHAALDSDDLLPVVLMETGHCMGLEHSEDPTSVMYPLMLASVPNQEDINSVINNLRLVGGGTGE